MRLNWVLFLVVCSSAVTFAYEHTAQESSSTFTQEEEQYAHSLYKIHCQGCHLPDGEGFAERGVPVIKDYMAYFLQVEGGREYLVQVPGASFSTIDDEDLALVMNWMLEAFSGEQLDENYQPYTSDEIHRLRAQRSTDVEARRKELVEAIEQAGLLSSSDNNNSN